MGRERKEEKKETTTKKNWKDDKNSGEKERKDK